MIKARSLCDAPEKMFGQLFEEERIYMGSSFCSQYFLKLKEESVKEAAKNNKKITLVLPVFTEKNLQTGKKKIADLLNVLGDMADEITVNDYGMLNYVYEMYNKKINLGRLFMKDYRDPRYEEYFQMELKPAIFSDHLTRMIAGYGISGLEFDCTHQSIDFTERPKNVTIAIYDTYCYMTVGQICEYASMHKPIDQKFRPNAECGLECMSNRISYDMIENRAFVRHGRAVYFENKDCRIKNAGEYRRIYSAFLCGLE